MREAAVAGRKVVVGPLAEEQEFQQMQANDARHGRPA
jgi:hypothetical protein